MKLYEQYLQITDLMSDEINEIAGTFGVVVSTIALVNYTWNFYRDNLSKTSKLCATKVNKPRCELIIKIKSTERVINDLKKAKMKCKKAQDSRKCNTAVDQKLDKAKSNLKQFKDEIDILLNRG
jgi:hypothetical protein